LWLKDIALIGCPFVERFQYLLLLVACVALTLPLEVFLGARVWRRPRRLLIAVLPGVVIFSLWDIAAIAHHQWRYNGSYVTGWDLPGRLPVEEVVFFAVIPTCALLTFEVVGRYFSRRR